MRACRPTGACGGVHVRACGERTRLRSAAPPTRQLKKRQRRLGTRRRFRRPRASARLPRGDGCALGVLRGYARALSRPLGTQPVGLAGARLPGSLPPRGLAWMWG